MILEAFCSMIGETIQIDDVKKFCLSTKSNKICKSCPMHDKSKFGRNKKVKNEDEDTNR